MGHGFYLKTNFINVWKKETEHVIENIIVNKKIFPFSGAHANEVAGEARMGN